MQKHVHDSSSYATLLLSFIKILPLVPWEVPFSDGDQALD
jgi:hypothetical protein